MTVIWVCLGLICVLAFVACLWQTCSSDLQTKLREVKALGFFEYENMGFVRTYRLVTDSVKQCLFVRYDEKGFFSFVYNMEGKLESSTYHEFGDMPDQPGEPAEDCGDIER